MKDNYYIGIDIGTYSVKVAVIKKDDNTKQVIGISEELSEGVSKGTITNIDSAVSSLSKALESAERMVGFPITNAVVGISGPNIKIQKSKGIAAVSRSSGEIREDDVDRAIEASQAVSSPVNYEILHVIPIEFIIDGHGHIKDPVGMVGVRLEVVTQIIHALSGDVKNLTNAVYRSGLDIDDLVLGVLACSDCVLTNRQKELGTCLINIGSSTTSVIVFEEGDLLEAAVIPIGSAHITSDLAIGLRTSIDVAERIKKAVGRIYSDSKKTTIDLADFDADETQKIPLSQISEIIEARVEEIFDHVNKVLSKIGRAGRLPGGVVVTGGGAHMVDMIEYVKNHFKLPASYGYPQGFDIPVEKERGLNFSTAIGLAKWASDEGQMKSKDIKGNFSNIIDKIISIFKS